MLVDFSHISLFVLHVAGGGHGVSGSLTVSCGGRLVFWGIGVSALIAGECGWLGWVQVLSCSLEMWGRSRSGDWGPSSQECPFWLVLGCSTTWGGLAHIWMSSPGGLAFVVVMMGADLWCGIALGCS